MLRNANGTPIYSSPITLLRNTKWHTNMFFTDKFAQQHKLAHHYFFINKFTKGPTNICFTYQHLSIFIAGAAAITRVIVYGR